MILDNDPELKTVIKLGLSLASIFFWCTITLMDKVIWNLGIVLLWQEGSDKLGPI